MKTALDGERGRGIIFGMDKAELDILPGRTETFLKDVCRRTGAELSVFAADPAGNVMAKVSGVEKSKNGLPYVIQSLPHGTREEACEGVAKQLLFRRAAELMGLPEASSFDELKLKMDVLMP